MDVRSRFSFHFYRHVPIFLHLASEETNFNQALDHTYLEANFVSPQQSFCGCDWHRYFFMGWIFFLVDHLFVDLFLVNTSIVFLHLYRCLVDRYFRFCNVLHEIWSEGVLSIRYCYLTQAYSNYTCTFSTQSKTASVKSFRE